MGEQARLFTEAVMAYCRDSNRREVERVQAEAAGRCPVCGRPWVMTCPQCGSTDTCFCREVTEKYHGYYYCGSCGRTEVDGDMMSCSCPEPSQEMDEGAAAGRREVGA